MVICIHFSNIKFWLSIFLFVILQDMSDSPVRSKRSSVFIGKVNRWFEDLQFTKKKRCKYITAEWQQQKPVKILHQKYQVLATIFIVTIFISMFAFTSWESVFFFTSFSLFLKIGAASILNIFKKKEGEKQRRHIYIKTKRIVKQRLGDSVLDIIDWNKCTVLTKKRT